MTDDDDEPRPVPDPYTGDTDTLGGTLGRTIGSAAVIFGLLAVVVAVAWLIFK
jgi:hypothetical protein